MQEGYTHVVIPPSPLKNQYSVCMQTTKILLPCTFFYVVIGNACFDQKKFWHLIGWHQNVSKSCNSKRTTVYNIHTLSENT
jgi:hypothetical protein